MCIRDSMGTLRKSGNTGTTTLDANVTLYNTGTVDVQSGEVAVLGSHTLTGGTLNFGINSLNNFSQIFLAGSAGLTGTLSANLNNGYSPVTGSSFALLSLSLIHICCFPGRRFRRGPRAAPRRESRPAGGPRCPGTGCPPPGLSLIHI